MPLLSTSTLIWALNIESLGTVDTCRDTNKDILLHQKWPKFYVHQNFEKGVGKTKYILVNLVSIFFAFCTGLAVLHFYVLCCILQRVVGWRQEQGEGSHDLAHRHCEETGTLYSEHCTHTELNSEHSELNSEHTELNSEHYTHIELNSEHSELSSIVNTVITIS